MKRRVAVRQHRIPFLHDRVIEEHAQLLLNEWAEANPAITAPPVPIEGILELHLELDFELGDLQTELGHPDVLGGIWFGIRTIKVDQSLDPNVDPSMLGRFRFTLAHEIGHWRLHRQHLMEDPGARSLFQADCEPAFVCRQSAGPREEIQANMFASCLLMPRSLVYDAWGRWRGSDDPAIIGELPTDGLRGAPDEVEERAMDRFCKPLAAQFEVSAQAMRYRLQKLELLVREKQPGLF
ncbi:MAG: ImmA/IrrE family metallo-endopeptidase [Phycisphaerales bacterium]|nr:ImmA/IrrE family metallo-endopeptidase [Phycisphaerales bacterium]